MGKVKSDSNGDKRKKTIIGISIAAIIVIIAVILLILGNKGYRSIKLLDMFGIVTYDRGSDKDVPVYEGMSLTAGDTMRTGGDGSYCSMMLDEDKFVYMEENSEVLFELAGRKGRSKTTLHLTQGAIVNEIENPLGDKESYEVRTPNSLMAVRGTRFRVSCYMGSDGIFYTRLSVLEGKVESWLIYPDGTVSDESHIVGVGDEVLIYYDKSTGVTDFVKSNDKQRWTDHEDGKVVTPIRWSQMPRQTIEMLYLRASEDGVVYEAITADELKALLEDPVVGSKPEIQIEPEGDDDPDDDPNGPDGSTSPASVTDSTPTDEPKSLADADDSDEDNNDSNNGNANGVKTQAKPKDPLANIDPAVLAALLNPTPTPTAAPTPVTYDDSSDDNSGSDSGSSGSDSGSSGSSGSTPPAPPAGDPPTIGPVGTVYTEAEATAVAADYKLGATSANGFIGFEKEKDATGATTGNYVVSATSERDQTIYSQIVNNTDGTRNSYDYDNGRLTGFTLTSDFSFANDGPMLASGSKYTISYSDASGDPVLFAESGDSMGVIKIDPETGNLVLEVA